MAWNLCSYLQWNLTPDAALAGTTKMSAETFAYIAKNGVIIPLTSEILPETHAVVDDDDNVNGIDYIFKGSVPCDVKNDIDTHETYGFKNRVSCNEELTGQAKIISVTGSLSCQPTVHMEHASGCPLFSFSGIVNFLDKNTWISGTILFVLGIVMVLFGSKFFRYVMGVIGAMVGFMAVMYIATLFGWLGATWSLIVWVCLAIVAGLAGGYFTWLLIPISIGLLGAMGGFVGGAVLFSLILSLTGYDELWLLITLVIVGAIAFGILGFKFRQVFLALTTSVVGGYMFMRGLTFWFGEYPSEMEMIGIMASGEELKLEWQFWCYFGTFILASLFGFIWQTKYYTDSDKAADDYYNIA